MKIYTKTGDSGDTSLFGGGRVRKSGLRVEAYGTVDELNSMLGLVRTYALPDPAPMWLETIQNDLFRVGADLATPPDAKTAYVVRVDSGPIEVLEQAIDRMEEQLPPLKNFILPGGVPAAATLHVARHDLSSCGANLRGAQRRASHQPERDDVSEPAVGFPVRAGAVGELAGGRERDEMVCAGVRITAPRESRRRYPVLVDSSSNAPRSGHPPARDTTSLRVPRAVRRR